MKIYRIIWAVALATVLVSCGKGPNEKQDTSEDAANRWIHSVMQEQYLYNEHVKTLTPDYTLSNEKFFESLLSRTANDGKHTDGRNYFYSYLERTDGTKALSGKTTTYGFEYRTYYFRLVENGVTKTYYTARVMFVVPGSPADRAGIVRGDWIKQIDGQNIPLDKVGLFTSGKAASFLIQRIALREGKYIPVYEKSVRIAAAEKMNVSPVYMSTVIETDGHRIGYVVYNAFDTGPNGPIFNDYTYDEEMKTVFADLKVQQVDELVLDLRYNGGGFISSCQLLCSLIVGQESLGQDFCIYKYNADMARQKGEPVTKFLAASQVPENLNLGRLYVLTGQWTASASELVINALRPYMTIKIAGTQTEGKNVGSYEIKSDTYHLSLHPITLQIFNKNHQSDYANGFAPDWTADDYDNQDQMLELGDPDEYVLRHAIADITGMAQPATKSAAGDKAPFSAMEDNAHLARTRGAIATPEQ